MKTVAIVIARMGSTRLPGKVLMPLRGSPVLAWVIVAAEAAPGVDEVWVATSTQVRDDKVEAWCIEQGVNCFRGSETDVLGRFTCCARAAGADVVVRLTGDCPFLDPQVIGAVIRLRQQTGAAYASNVNPPTWPDGLDCECFTREALEAANAEAWRPLDRDTVTQWIIRNRSRFPAANLTCPVPLERERWVVDTSEDYRFCNEIANELINPRSE
jgi:glutamate-1-semialdehyde 2,1-aminomutase/spore coat polysaccharide biosynthesis protein SpsF